MLKVKLSFLILFISISFYSFSQEDYQNKKIWTLEECINYAKKNNIQVKITELSVQTNQNSYFQSKGALLPDLYGSANHQYAYGRSIDPFTNTYTNDPVQSNNFQISSSLTVFNGFQTLNTIRQSKINLKASTYDLEQARYTLTLNVVNAYMNVIFNQELLEKAKFLVNTTTEQLQRTEKLVKAGALAENSFLEIKAQKATDELGIVTAENNLSISKLNLAQLLQIPIKDTFDIVIPDINIESEINNLDASPQQIYEIAEKTQPNIISSELNIKSSIIGIDIARGARLPQLSLSGGIFTQYSSIGSTSKENGVILSDIGFIKNDPSQIVSTYRPSFSQEKLSFNSQFDNNRRGYLTFSLSIPIFTKFQTQSNINRAKIERSRAELNSVDAKNVLRQNIEQAYIDARSAINSYKASRNQVEALREAFRITEQRYNVGAVNAVDYTVAKNNLNTAESDLIRAKYQYIFTLKVLDFYQNKPLTLDTK